MMGPFWDSLVTTTSLTALAGMALKFYISSSLKKLEDVHDKIQVIIVKLEHLEETYDIVRDHDKKIAFLEAVYGASAAKRRSDPPYKS
jgi:hypothetical protein